MSDYYDYDYESEAIRRAITAHRTHRPGHQVIRDINVTCDVVCETCGKHGRWFGSAIGGIGYGISTLRGWSRTTRPEDF